MNAITGKFGVEPNCSGRLFTTMVYIYFATLSWCAAQGGGGYNITNELAALFLAPYHNEQPLGEHGRLFLHRTIDRSAIEAALMKSARLAVDRHPKTGSQYADRLLLDHKLVLGEEFLRWDLDSPSLQTLRGTVYDPWIRSAAEDLAAIHKAVSLWEPKDGAESFSQWCILNRTPHLITEAKRPEPSPKTFSLQDILTESRIYRFDIDNELELVVFAAFTETTDARPNYIEVWRAQKTPRKKVGTGRIYDFTTARYVASPARVTLADAIASPSTANGGGGYNVTNELVALFVAPYSRGYSLGERGRDFLYRSYDRIAIENAIMQAALWIVERHPDTGKKYANRLLMDNVRVLGERFLSWKPESQAFHGVYGALDNPYLFESATELAVIYKAAQSWEPKDEAARFSRWCILNRAPQLMLESEQREQTDPATFSLREIFPKSKLYRSDIVDEVELMIFTSFAEQEDSVPSRIEVWRAQKSPRKRLGASLLYTFISDSSMDLASHFPAFSPDVASPPATDTDADYGSSVWQSARR